MAADKPKRVGCKCPQGAVDADCYHHSERRKTERQRNTSKGGYTKAYYKHNREAEADKTRLRALVELTVAGQLDPATLTAVKGGYAEIKDYIRLQGELHRQYVILPDLMEAERGEPGES
jgi:hypothetical protein